MLVEAYHSLRSIFRTPGLSLTIVATLALCIAATAAVGNLINGYFQKLPVPDADEVLGIFSGGPESGPYGRVSYPDYLDYANGADSFEGIAGSASFGASLNTQRRTDWVWGSVVTEGFFDTLLLRPASGRFFTDEEEAPGGPPAAVLSYRFWQSRFGGNREILDETVRFNRQTFTIIGVAPRSFVGLNAFHHPDVWIPIAHSQHVIRNSSSQMEDRSRPWLTLIGRLRQGARPEAAEAQMSILAERIEASSPRGEDPRIITLLPAYHVPPTAREWYLPTSRMLLVAVGFLLLIGCLNVANLFYTKALARRRELATRLALGSSRWTLIRLIFFEVSYLVLAAGFLAFLTVGWTGRRISAYFAPPVAGEMGGAPLFQPDLRVLLFIAVVSFGVTLLVALIPAFRISRPSLLGALQQDLNNIQPRNWLKTANLLLVLQVALAVALLTCTGLVWRSMANILERDPGYPIDDVVLASIRIPTDTYSEPEDGVRFYRRVLDAASGISGMEGISITSLAPLSGWARRDTVLVPDFSEDQWDVDQILVSPTYFETLGIQFVAGEGFGWQYDRENLRITVVNETFAERFWSDSSSAVGRQLVVGDTPYTVLGVVEDTQYLSLQEEPRALAYYSINQRFLPQLTLVGRSGQPTASLAPQIREIVRDLDVEAAVPFVTSLRQWLEGSIWEPRLRTDILKAFGLIGLVLAAVGVFGLMRYRVIMEEKDIGVRLAVGASRARILTLVLKRGGWIGVCGILLGFPLAYFSGRLVESFLHGVEPFDGGITASLSLLLLAVVLLAAFLPGLRAARSDPLRVIRHD